jgi:hypothetical protein
MVVRVMEKERAPVKEPRRDKARRHCSIASGFAVVGLPQLAPHIYSISSVWVRMRLLSKVNL